MYVHIDVHLKLSLFHILSYMASEHLEWSALNVTLFLHSQHEYSSKPLVLCYVQE